MPYVAWHPRTSRPLVVLTRSGPCAKVRLVHSEVPFEVPVAELQHYPWVLAAPRVAYRRSSAGGQAL